MAYGAFNFLRISIYYPLEDVHRMLGVVWLRQGWFDVRRNHSTINHLPKYIKGSQHWKWSEILKNLRVSPFGKGYGFLPQYHLQPDPSGCTGSLKSKLKFGIFRQVYSGCYYCTSSIWQEWSGMLRVSAVEWLIYISGFWQGKQTTFSDFCQEEVFQLWDNCPIFALIFEPLSSHFNFLHPPAA